MILLIVAVAMMFKNQLFADQLHDQRATIISGSVNADMRDRFLALEPDSEVTVRSGGGNAGVGNEIANIIEMKRIKIRIDGLCASACAEFFITSTPSLKIEPTAVIALHLNDFAFANIMENEELPDAGLCSAPRVANLRTRYSHHNLNADFYKETVRRLEFLRYERAIMPSGCLSQNTWTRHVAWLPSSSQIRSLWGIQFDGPVCADDPKCLQSALSSYFVSGKTVVVADDVVTVGD